MRETRRDEKGGRRRVNGLTQIDSSMTRDGWPVRLEKSLSDFTSLRKRLSIRVAEESVSSSTDRIEPLGRVVSKKDVDTLDGEKSEFCIDEKEESNSTSVRLGKKA